MQIFWWCKAGSFPSTYLGLPLCTVIVSPALCSPVIDRVGKRLASWKAKYLSLGGCIILIKSALSMLPIYFMSVFKCPMSVVRRIEKYEGFSCGMVAGIKGDSIF